MSRPDWDTFFMTIAYLVSQRSPDTETKHGSVLVDKNKRILSLGFNGFPRGCNDKELPSTRPEKYFFVIHSEDNCLMNANVIPEPEKCTLYVTGRPCHECTKKIIQYGIGTVVFGDISSACMQTDPEYLKKVNMMLKDVPVQFVQLDKPHLEALKTNMVGLLKQTADYINDRA